MCSAQTSEMLFSHLPVSECCQNAVMILMIKSTLRPLSDFLREAELSVFHFKGIWIFLWINFGPTTVYLKYQCGFFSVAS